MLKYLRRNIGLNWFKLGFLFLIFLSSATVSYLHRELMPIAVANRKLSLLPVPELPKIQSPDPLVLTKISSSVLGFGTLDPFDIINEVNVERKKAGVPELRANETLMHAARLRANTILKYENFSHQDPFENIELTTVLPRFNYRYAYATENIGMGGNSGRDFVNGFMNSTSHRLNLLDPKLRDTGTAVVDGPFDRYYVNIVVQLFAIPAGKDEYLGYTAKDKTFYQTQLKAVKYRLNPLVRFFSGIFILEEFTGGKYQKLEQQRYLLETIISIMRNEKPLDNSHVKLIREYNKNLGSL